MKVDTKCVGFEHRDALLQVTLQKLCQQGDMHEVDVTRR
jgi:hypothetical protein